MGVDVGGCVWMCVCAASLAATACLPPHIVGALSVGPYKSVAVVLVLLVLLLSISWSLSKEVVVGSASSCSCAGSRE